MTCHGPECADPAVEGDDYCAHHRFQLDAFEAWQEELATTT